MTSPSAPPPLAPDQELMRRARRIAIRSRKRVSQAMAGEFRSVFRGTGVEFAEVREYAWGDDTRAIDWNVTARTGRPFIKRFVESRERSLWLVVDRSASMDFGSGARTKADAAAELAAVIALAAQMNGDRVGLLAFSPRGTAVLRPGRGPEWSMRILHRLLAAPPGDVATPEPLAATLGRRLRGHAVVFVISDFAWGPANGGGGEADAIRSLRSIAGRHDVVAARVVDPRERALDGAGLLECVDPESGERFRLDAGDAGERLAFARAAALRLDSQERALREAAVDRFDLSPEDDVAVALLRFFARRERGRR